MKILEGKEFEYDDTEKLWREVDGDALTNADVVDGSM
jgi:hypothetical protein